PRTTRTAAGSNHEKHERHESAELRARVRARSARERTGLWPADRVHPCSESIRGQRPFVWFVWFVDKNTFVYFVVPQSLDPRVHREERVQGARPRRPQPPRRQTPDRRRPAG